MGIRFSAVMNRPNQAARPSGPEVHGEVVGDFAHDEPRHPLKQEWLAQRDAEGLGVGRADLRFEETQNENGDAHDETRDGPGQP